MSDFALRSTPCCDLTHSCRALLTAMAVSEIINYQEHAPDYEVIIVDDSVHCQGDLLLRSIEEFVENRVGNHSRTLGELELQQLWDEEKAATKHDALHDWLPMLDASVHAPSTDRHAHLQQKADQDIADKLEDVDTRWRVETPGFDKNPYTRKRRAPHRAFAPRAGHALLKPHRPYSTVRRIHNPATDDANAHRRRLSRLATEPSPSSTPPLWSARQLAQSEARNHKLILELDEERKLREHVRGGASSRNGQIQYICVSSTQAPGQSLNFGTWYARGDYVAVWLSRHFHSSTRLHMQASVLDGRTTSKQAYDLVALPHAFVVDVTERHQRAYSITSAHISVEEHRAEPDYTTLMFRRSLWLNDTIRFASSASLGAALTDFVERARYDVDGVRAQLAVLPPSTAEYAELRDANSRYFVGVQPIDVEELEWHQWPMWLRRVAERLMEVRKPLLLQLGWDCCVPHETAGCSKRKCPAQVCPTYELDCCTLQWNEECARLARFFCGNLCEAIGKDLRTNEDEIVRPDQWDRKDWRLVEKKGRINHSHCCASDEVSRACPNLKKKLIDQKKMSDDATKLAQEAQTKLVALQKRICDQKELVKSLKANPAEKEKVAPAVADLKAWLAEEKELMKKVKNANKAATTEEKLDISQANCEILLKRRFFVAPSFEIYGSVAGLYDFGPPGCAVKNGVLSLWRQMLVLSEGLFEVECTSVTPERVLEVSEHTKKFQDFLVADIKTGNLTRADHLLEDHMDKLIAEASDAALVAEYTKVRNQADAYSLEELGAVLKKYKVVSADGNEISEPRPFNLMFQTQIGPTGTQAGFLRPETAQGIFVNFKRLLEYNNSHLPFGAAQVGQAYRNEISPQKGLLRLREFTLAEIEYFVRKDDKDSPVPHERFADVRGTVLRLFTADEQLTTMKTVEMSAGDAVDKKVICTEALAYFMCRSFEFFVACGLDADKIRFRQHLRNEMAHYADDCWDAEVLTTYGWIEVAGHADRSAFDLTKHSEGSGTRLEAYENFAVPRDIDTVRPVLQKKVIGQAFKKAAGALTKHLESISDVAEAKRLQERLDADGKVTLKYVAEEVNKKTKEVTREEREHEVTKEMVKYEIVQKKQNGETFVPSVVEPSYGIGRIVYCVFEHSFRTREGDDQRSYLALKPSIAPFMCSLLPLLKKEPLLEAAHKLIPLLQTELVSFRLDSTGDAIGRRYARTDEIGIPFGITIDFETVENSTVTLRERDSMQQVRVPMKEVGSVIKRLCDGRLEWSQVIGDYPLQADKDN